MLERLESRRRRPLIVIGSGGNALDVLDAVEALNAQSAQWEVIGLLDDAANQSSRAYGLPILGHLHDASRLAGEEGVAFGAMFLNSIGSERSHAQRTEMLVRTGLADAQFATLVHPAAQVSSHAQLGHGCFVGFGACVGGQVRAADHVWIGPGCIVGHDSLLEAGTVLAPRATISGFVRVGDCCYVGSAAAVRQRVWIGNQALIGIGAVVLRDVSPGATVVGNPARDLTRRVSATAPAE